MNNALVKEAIEAQAEFHLSQAYQCSYSHRLRPAIKAALNEHVGEVSDEIVASVEREVAPLVMQAIHSAEKARELRIAAETFDA